MAETVDSLMNAHVSRGRNPHPFNLNVEIRLRFNLAPLHMLNYFTKAKVKKRIEEDGALYVRTLESTRKDKLKFQLTSASVGNFLKQQKLAMHLCLLHRCSNFKINS